MVDACEIKVTLRPDEELKGLRALELDEDTAEVRLLYFPPCGPDPAAGRGTSRSRMPASSWQRR
jgi:hypothetical protein